MANVGGIRGREVPKAIGKEDFIKEVNAKEKEANAIERLVSAKVQLTRISFAFVTLIVFGIWAYVSVSTKQLADIPWGLVTLVAAYVGGTSWRQFLLNGRK